MADEPVDLTQDLLRQIRSEQTAFRTLVERRFDAVESDLLEMKRALRGLTYMMAAFNGRLEDIETRVDRLATS